MNPLNWLYVFVLVLAGIVGGHEFFKSGMLEMAWDSATIFLLSWYFIISIAILLMGIFLKIGLFTLKAFLDSGKHEEGRKCLTKKQVDRIYGTKVHICSGILSFFAFVSGACLICQSDISNGFFRAPALHGGLLLIIIGMRLPGISIIGIEAWRDK